MEYPGYLHHTRRIYLRQLEKVKKYTETNSSVLKINVKASVLAEMLKIRNHLH